MLRIGIVGLGQVGKTTLFRILTRSHGSGLGSGKPEAHVGVVSVPDARLDRLVQIYQPEKAVYAKVEYVDTPGSVIELARTGSQAATLRGVDALAQVVRVFEGEDPASLSSADPRGEVESVEVELILSDLDIVEKRLERLEKDIKKQKNPALEKEHRALAICKAALEKQTPLREVALGPEEQRAIRGFTFLSLKPLLYVLNLSEKDAARTSAAEEFAAELGLERRANTRVAAICGKIEAELAELDPAQATEFLDSYGLKESAMARLVRSSYGLLGLISFFTVGDNECRAWAIRDGTTAFGAAGEVHTDMQKGFIRAEVVSFRDLIDSGSFPEARNRARLRLEGRDYVVRDGEVVRFRHSGP